MNQRMKRLDTNPSLGGLARSNPGSEALLPSSLDCHGSRLPRNDVNLEAWLKPLTRFD